MMDVQVSISIIANPKNNILFQNAESSFPC